MHKKDFFLATILEMLIEKLGRNYTRMLCAILLVGWLVSLFNGVSTLFRLFDAKAILLEEQ